VAEALPLLEQALEQAAAMGVLEDQALRAAWLSEACLLAGRLADAIEYARHAIELSHQHKERGNQARVLRVLGEIAARGDPPDAEQAERYYHQALALAEELGMRPLAAHCHLGLGTLYQQLGRHDQAQVELIQAAEQYRAMEMTFWLAKADAALAQVAS
jgi:tetratricopeptide (TPR) repeat protein